MGGMFAIVVIVYLICHIPAIILLAVGFAKRKSKPELAKKLFIAAGIYFLIGAGLCGALFANTN